MLILILLLILEFFSFFQVYKASYTIRMPRPSRPTSRQRRSRQDGGESPIAHRTRSRAHRRRRQEDHRSRSPRDRGRAPQQPPSPPPVIEPRGEVQVICSICFSDFQDGEDTRILPCIHQFHTECIQRWLQQSGTCPLCRAAAVPVPQQPRGLLLQDIEDLLNNWFAVHIDVNGAPNQPFMPRRRVRLLRI